jgi:hypothetical protein
MQKLLLASTYIFRLRCVQLFIVPHLFRKPNYKLPGFLLWLHRFAVICRVGCDSDASTLWISDATQCFSNLHCLFTFFLPIIYRLIIPFSFFPHAIFSFLLSLLTSASYKIQMPHKNVKTFRGFFFSTALNFFLIFYVFIIPLTFLLLFSFFLIHFYSSIFVLSCSHCFSFIAPSFPPSFPLFHFQ